jgi:hypothetical protein
MRAMKWYNAIECTNTHSHPFVGQEVDFRGGSDWDVILGKRVSDWDKNVKFWTENDEANGTPDDVLQHCVVALPVFSSGLRKALETAGISGIQYLPVRVQRPNGEAIPGYSIANIVNLLPALDIENSMVTKYGKSRPDRIGQISGILKPVLKRDVVTGFDICRLAEFPLRYYVSQRFREIFVEGKFTGYTFKEVPLS